MKRLTARPARRDDARLSGLVDAELTVKELRAVNDLFKAKPEAYDEYCRLCGVVRTLKRLRERPVAPPDEFWSQTYERLRHFAHTEACTPTCRQRLGTVLRAVALACVALGAVKSLSAAPGALWWLGGGAVAALVAAGLRRTV
jgi:hypothetical protein